MTRNKNITILGSTGSIGQSALEVVRQVEGLNVLAISGRSNLSKLVEQALEFGVIDKVLDKREVAAEDEPDDMDAAS